MFQTEQRAPIVQRQAKSRAQSTGPKVQGTEPRTQVPGCRTQGPRRQGAELRAQGSGCRARGPGPRV